MLEHIFVYGTLKSGQCRERCWPSPPLKVRRAWTFGELYDLGAFPAMIQGVSRIAGQVWTYRAADATEVFRVLDEIEGTNQAGYENEYDRQRVPVTLPGGGELVASAYFYAKKQELTAEQRISPAFHAGESYAIWPRGSSWS